MAKQGDVTRKYANSLTLDGWSVAYVCIPNTAHIGVVPIPTAHGSSKQRYPDIVALKGNRLLIVEVEISLNEYVYEDITLRFSEMNYSLSNEDLFLNWRWLVSHNCGTDIPLDVNIENQLIIIKPLKTDSFQYKELLENNNIKVIIP